MNNFTKRLGTAIIYVLLLVSSFWFGPYSAACFLGLVSIICLGEFYSLFKKNEETSPQTAVGIAIGIILFLLITFSGLSIIETNSLILAIPLFSLPFLIELYRKRKNPILNLAITILGIVYIIIPFSVLFIISIDEVGSYNYGVLLGFFFILWLNDTGAYLVGSKFGKRKLFPSVSPKKSWEGTLGGVLFGLIMGYVNSVIFPSISLENWLAISAIIVIFGSLGDLVESLFKRSLDIKDSSNILPGHGGFLDRFDSVLIASPMVFLYIYFIGI